MISDFQYNPTTDTYEPVDAALNELNKVEYSPYIPLDAAYAGSTVTSALAGAPVMTADVSVLHTQKVWQLKTDCNTIGCSFAAG